MQAIHGTLARASKVENFFVIYSTSHAEELWSDVDFFTAAAIRELSFVIYYSSQIYSQNINLDIIQTSI